jgi:hypothetical protein
MQNYYKYIKCYKLLILFRIQNLMGQFAGGGGLPGAGAAQGGAQGHPLQNLMQMYVLKKVSIFSHC